MRCYVKDCRTTRSRQTDQKRSFFAFPKDEHRLMKWIKFCQQTQPFNREKWRICSLHFKEEDFERTLQYKMGLTKTRALKKEAVPCCQVKSTDGRDNRAQRRENKRIVDSLLKENCSQPAMKPNKPSKAPSKSHNEDKVFSKECEGLMENMIVTPDVKMNLKEMLIVNDPIEVTNTVINDSRIESAAENNVTTFHVSYPIESSNKAINYSRIVNSAKNNGTTFQTKSLKKQLEEVKQQNKNLEMDFLRKELMYKVEIRNLEHEVKMLKSHCKKVEEQLELIYTDFLTKKIRNRNVRDESP